MVLNVSFCLKNMLNVLVIGDPHFKISNIKETDEMTVQIIEVAKNKKPDFIIVLGDILDRHELINMMPLIRSIKFLKQLQDIAFLYVIIGNHDRKNNKDFLTEDHPFTALKYWDNTKIIDTVEIININKYDKNFKFTMVPYVEPGRFEEALSLKPNWHDSVCIFCHQEFKGAQMGAIKSINGDVWCKTNPYIISGHVHDYQKLQNNILYIGTPIQHKFGDNANKIIAFFKFDNIMIDKHDSCQFQAINLNVTLKKIIHLTPKNICTYDLEQGIDAKIIITGTSTEIKSIMKHPNISIWQKLGARITYKDIIAQRTPISSIQYNPSNKLENYSTVLYNHIKDDKDLHLLHNEIFGTH